jgi:hypothetical protein
MLSPIHTYDIIYICISFVIFSWDILTTNINKHIFFDPILIIFGELETKNFQSNSDFPYVFKFV